VRRAALNCADLQHIATARLLSQSDQPAGPSVLPPFSGKLCADGKLKLRNEKCKQIIYDFFKDKNQPPLTK